MPGLSCIVAREAKHFPPPVEIEKAFASVSFLPSYKARRLFSDNTFGLYASSYDGYPISIYEDKLYVAILEGRIYNMAAKDLEQSLLAAARELFTTETGEATALHRLLKEADGDFVYFLGSKQTGTIALGTDRFARLPVYLSASNSRLVVSRDVAFPLSFLSRIKFDQLGLAQFLLFGFPIGTRMLFDGLTRLPPGTVLIVDRRSLTHAVRPVRELTLPNTSAASSPADIGEELNDLFIDSCRRRTDNERTIVVSLSGGLDSRSVAAGLSSWSSKAFAATFEDAEGNFSFDREIAQDIAALLELDWRSYALDPAATDDLGLLLDLKAGHNFLGMAFILQFYRHLTEEFGHGLLFATGDGGDKLLPALTPNKRFRDLRALASYIIDRHNVFTIEEIRATTGVEPVDLFKELEKALENYPEQNFADKYRHFVLRERTVNWLFEGEDRARAFFWSLAPFYSGEFYDAALACPDSLKRNHRLYAAFLKALSPELARLPDSNEGAAVGSPQYRLRKRIYSLGERSPGISRKIKQRLFSPGLKTQNSLPVRGLQQALTAPEPLTSSLRLPGLQQIVETADNHSQSQLYHLLTVVLLVEKIMTGVTSLAALED